ncbi:rhodanese-like domain-containing protein [Saccharopolyspora rosea]|uniref:Rhodanese-like domain-containing protein n=1 Tax=Saccharopolyspora rosea TaxID=524884 RepID=A0ABW3FQ55_9PSEU|nr:rhodanese-like domain-containing protein [Saccharopolyspora rosea]
MNAFVGASRRGARLVDERSPEEYASGHLPGAVNVPLEDMPAAPQRFAGQEWHVIRRSGGRSRQAAEAMNAAGARAVSVSAGTAEWIEAGHEIERSHGRPREGRPREGRRVQR